MVNNAHQSVRQIATESSSCGAKHARIWKFTLIGPNNNFGSCHTIGAGASASHNFSIVNTTPSGICHGIS